jgi:hypothetical protein
MATFDEIHSALLFVSSDSYGINRALLCLDNGEIYYHSEDGVFDELDEDKFDCDHFLEIPHRNELDLGHELVAEFVEEQMAEDLDLIREIFSRRGAYRSFKDLLDDRGLLQSWHDFENHREKEALREWCRENKLHLPPA